MSRISLLKHRLLVGFSAAFFVGQSMAVSVISGKLWRVPDAVAQSAVPANLPTTTPDVTFDVNSPLNFNSPSTIQSFLDSGGAFNIVQNTAGTLSEPISNGVVSTLISFQGVVTVANGQQFTVTQDDGLTLVIGNVNLGFNSGPTAPTTATVTYTGPTGTFPFQLVYGECCGGSAVLQIDLAFANAPIPEPNSPTLLVAGLVMLLARRKAHLSVRNLVVRQMTCFGLLNSFYRPCAIGGETPMA